MSSLLQFSTSPRQPRKAAAAPGSTAGLIRRADENRGKPGAEATGPAVPWMPRQLVPPVRRLPPGGFQAGSSPSSPGPGMAMLFGTNSAALILQRCCRFSFSLSRWERAGVRVLSSRVPLRKAPSPGLRPASPKGRGKIDNSRLVGHIPCRTPFARVGPVRVKLVQAERRRERSLGAGLRLAAEGLEQNLGSPQHIALSQQS